MKIIFYDKLASGVTLDAERKIPEGFMRSLLSPTLCLHFLFRLIHWKATRKEGTIRYIIAIIDPLSCAMSKRK